MKLNLDITQIGNPEPQRLLRYESPVDWWKVVTEGDCEGRSEKDLGNYYGHVAEIGLSLADKAYYRLRFEPHFHSPPPPEVIPTYIAKKKSVWISLGIESGTWNMKGTDLVKWYKEWLNVTDPEIVIKETHNHMSFFASVHVSLK